MISLLLLFLFLAGSTVSNDYQTSFFFFFFVALHHFTHKNTSYQISTFVSSGLFPYRGA